MSEEPGSPERKLARTPLELAVLQRSAAWNGLRPVIEERFPLAVEAALSATGAAALQCGEITLVLADDVLQRELNRTYRGIDKSTNVLAFSGLMDAASLPSRETGVLGDIVLAFETCAAEAKVQGKKPEDHALHLAIHGLLHLLGFSHEEADDAQAMEDLERHILAVFGISDPYAEPTATYQAASEGRTGARIACRSRDTADG